MDDQQNESRQTEVRERAVWEAPEIRRLETRDAEGAAGTGADGGVFS